MSAQVLNGPKPKRQQAPGGAGEEAKREPLVYSVGDVRHARWQAASIAGTVGALIGLFVGVVAPEVAARMEQSRLERAAAAQAEAIAQSVQSGVAIGAVVHEPMGDDAALTPAEIKERYNKRTLEPASAP